MDQIIVNVVLNDIKDHDKHMCVFKNKHYRIKIIKIKKDEICLDVKYPIKFNPTSFWECYPVFLL